MPPANPDLSPTSTSEAYRPWESIALLFGYILLVFCLAAPTAALFSHWEAADWMFDKGEDHMARRVAMIWALVLTPFLFVWFRPRFWSDAGWQPWPGYRQRVPWWNFLLQGLGLGMLIVGGVMAVSLLLGTREINFAYANWVLALNILRYGLIAVLIALLEETLIRGFLLRSMLRRMGLPLAIGLSSLLFAAAHFAWPDPAAFETSGFFARSGNVFLSFFTHGPDEPYPLLMFLNLTLMGVLMGVLVLRTGSIWIAAGVHAGAVWVKKVNSIVADRVHDVEHRWLIGGRSDHLDSLLLVILLAVLCVAVWQSLQAADHGTSATPSA